MKSDPYSRSYRKDNRLHTSTDILFTNKNNPINEGKGPYLQRSLQSQVASPREKRWHETKSVDSTQTICPSHTVTAVTSIHSSSFCFLSKESNS